ENSAAHGQDRAASVRHDFVGNRPWRVSRGSRSASMDAHHNEFCNALSLCHMQDAFGGKFKTRHPGRRPSRASGGMNSSNRFFTPLAIYSRCCMGTNGVTCGRVTADLFSSAKESAKGSAFSDPAEKSVANTLFLKATRLPSGSGTLGPTVSNGQLAW